MKISRQQLLQAANDGILWQHHEAAITLRVQVLLPQALRELLAARGQV
jgi:hypothetical protein